MNQVSTEIHVLVADLLKRTEPMPVNTIKILAGLLTHFARRIERHDKTVLISPYWMIPVAVVSLVIGLLL